MLETITKIREFLKGKKTYLVAVAALVTATIAWSQSEITGVQYLQTLFVALQTAFIRAGISNGK